MDPEIDRLIIELPDEEADPRAVDTRIAADWARRVVGESLRRACESTTRTLEAFILKEGIGSGARAGQEIYATTFDENGTPRILRVMVTVKIG